MTGHAGSSPATVTVYGGVYPTCHAADILTVYLEVDVIVRGEGEAVALALVTALANGQALSSVAGLVCRDGGEVPTTPAAPSIVDLDAYYRQVGVVGGGGGVPVAHASPGSAEHARRVVRTAPATARSHDFGRSID